jgi:hypothetical protein
MSPLMSLCLVFLFSFILAAPLDTRTVFDPQILSPNADSVWTVGQVETVVWQVPALFSSDTSLSLLFRNATGIPAGVTGMIKLGFQTSDSENLCKRASSFLTFGRNSLTLTLPSLSDYFGLWI